MTKYKKNMVKVESTTLPLDITREFGIRGLSQISETSSKRPQPNNMTNLISSSKKNINFKMIFNIQ